MTSNLYREQRGPYLVEAGAADLDRGKHWQPWVKLALPRRADGAPASRSFDRLKPVFGTRAAALRYAIELGRRLADEGIDLFPASSDGGNAPWPPHPLAGRRGRYVSRDQRGRSGNGSVRSMIGMLAGIFAR